MSHDDPGTARRYLARRYRFDQAAAVALLLAASPILVILVLWVLVCDGRPVLFRDLRVVAGGRVEAIPKIRTYRRHHRPSSVTREADGRLSVDSSTHELLPGASVIRLLGLDELPQLWPVATGRMALIGPRPQPPEYTALNEWRPAWLRPGILAAAAASGRRSLTIEERVSIDRRYVKGASLRADASIVVRTVLALVRGTR